MSNPNRSNRSLPRSVLAVLITSLLVGMALLALSPGMARADPSTIYVDADAPGPGHDGTSWATAYTTVQDALAAATVGDAIWVAEGVYYPDEGTGQTNNDPDATFTLRPGVALYGGFDPQSGADAWEERDWDAHVSVLSGDIDDDDVTDARGVVTDTFKIAGSNAYQVVTGGGVTETSRLDGFTVTAGNANGGGMNPGDPRKNGGGMYNVDSTPTLANVTFSGNRAERDGGGMYNHQSGPTLTGVTFSGNWADGESGGGMYNYRSSPRLTNVLLSSNRGRLGGGMYNIRDSSPTLTNVTFSGNFAWAGRGGGMRNYWGSSPTLVNVTFSGNRAGSYGGGMGNASSSDPTMINCILWGNAAPNGPQIHNEESNPSVSYSDVQDAFAGGVWDGTLGSDGGHNIDADPLFVDPVAASEAPTTRGNYRLLLDSPAIDVGDNLAVTVDTDLDGNPRIVDGDRDDQAVVDMGAYEAQAPVGGVTVPSAPIAALRFTAGLAALVGLLLTGTWVLRRRNH
jgi:hypothetical protein